MKFRKLSLFLAIILTVTFFISSCTNNNENTDDTKDESQYTDNIKDENQYTEVEYDLSDDTKMDRGVLIYMGYNGNFGYSSDVLYHEFTQEDFEILRNAGVKQYIILPNGVYNFTKADDTSTQILHQEDIEDMTLDDVGANNPDDLIKIKEQYAESIKNMSINAQRGYDYLVDEYIKIADNILTVQPDADLWFTFPAVAVFHLAEKFNEVYKEYVFEALKEKLDDDIWENNVRGFYYSEEGITQWFTDFNTENFEDFDNPIVKNMRYLSTLVHENGKKFLWIPYYRSGGDAKDAFRVGYVANKTNIFDFICLQPNYVFRGEHERNVGAIERSVENGAVMDHKGTVIGLEKISKTQIGPEMETDIGIGDEEFAERFEEYVNAYFKFVDKAPMVFYAGDKTALMKDENIENIKRMYNPD